MTIGVAGRTYPAAIRDDGTVAMGVGDVEVGETETIELGEERIELTAVSVGNPHAVVRLAASRDDLLRLGPLIERHERFPERTNVQLVDVDGPNELTVLVWERGAGETSASGSSAVAAAAAAVANGWCESPVTVRMPGGELGSSSTTRRGSRSSARRRRSARASCATRPRARTRAGSRSGSAARRATPCASR